MLKLLAVCILFWVSVTSKTEKLLKSNEELKEEFEQFTVEYNREYEDDNEKALRFSYFVNNVRIAEELNKKYKEAEFGITKFSDWSKEELEQILGYKPNTKDLKIVDDSMPLCKFNHGQAPAAWDWRKHNAVTPVKDQRWCGSCWAFSAIGNIEGQYALKYHKLVSLSEQELVDCSKNDNGCIGGDLITAFTDLKVSQQLVESERSYPYYGFQEACRYNKKLGVAKVIGFNNLHSKDEEELKQYLYQYGPLAFAMNASQLPDFKGGIFSGCFNDTVNHGLLLVGYGTSDAGKDYWIVKNSWGSDWNEDGYFKMLRGINICNILSYPNIITSQVA